MIRSSLITLLTDFGYSDPFAGVMKGVILNICPEVRIVDITHNIAPQNIDEAAFKLKSCYSYFPKGTIHTVVVDPGVGTDRAVLCVQTDRYTFLAPDNGVLKTIFHEYPDCDVYRITNPDYFLPNISRTFHGRDVFAPAAAHLTKGVPLSKMGEITREYVSGKVEVCEVMENRIEGKIIAFDRFGNGITNIEAEKIGPAKKIRIEIKGLKLSELSQSYQAVPAGEPLAIVGSCGTIEIAVNRQNAKEKLNLQTGDVLTIVREQDEISHGNK
jgi:S-adenosylmethionine hydrolase